MRASIAALLLASLGCGTTQIVTAEPTASIFVDGRSVGQGRATIDKRGTPGSARVLVKAPDGRTRESVIQRNFTGFTLLAGLFTYGICLAACWEYPDTVFVALPLPPPVAPSPTADAPGADPWTIPPPGWHRSPEGEPVAAVPAEPPAPAPVVF